MRSLRGSLLCSLICADRPTAFKSHLFFLLFYSIHHIQYPFTLTLTLTFTLKPFAFECVFSYLPYGAGVRLTVGRGVYGAGVGLGVYGAGVGSSVGG